MLCPAAEPRSEWGVFSAGLSREEWSLCLLVPLPSGYTVLVSHSAHQNPPPLWKKTRVLFHQAAFQTDCSRYRCMERLLPRCTIMHLLYWISFCSHQPICPIPLVRSLWISALSSSISASALKSVWSYCPILKGHSFDFWEISPVTRCQLEFLLLLPFDPNGKANFWLTSTQMPICWVLIWPI